MEYLQDLVLGQKSAVSSTILSLSENISLNESENLLSQFYEKNKDTVDAAYKVRLKSGNTTIIRVVDVNSIPSESIHTEIYIVSPERASDPVVIAEIGRRARDLHLKRSIGDLSGIGYFVNPLLDSEFVIDPKRRTYGPLFGASNQSRDSSVPSRPAVNRTNKVDVKVDPEVFSSKNLKEEEKAVKEKRKHEAVRPKSEAPTPERQAKFTFAKTNKADALKSGRRKQSLPVKEVFVQGDANDNDAEDENEESDASTRDKKKAEQMKNLAKIYDDDDRENAGKKTADSTHEAEDDGSEASDVSQPEDEAYDDKMDVEPIQGLDDNKSDSKASNRDSSVDLKNSEEPKQKESSPSTGSAQKPRKKRVLKTIVTKDDEGFDVRHQVYVDEDSDSNADSGEAEKSGESNEKQAGQGETSLESSNKPPKIPKVEDNSGEKPKGTKKAKAPPTIKKGKQTSLMSFFNSK